MNLSPVSILNQSDDMKSLSITGVQSGVKPDIPRRLSCLP
ncbi:hypothetical protein EC23916_3632 [Escherichia coli 2.3916]|nr:hypothetical protein EC23916_3632 [Escherichia coli 2.3916]